MNSFRKTQYTLVLFPLIDTHYIFFISLGIISFIPTPLTSAGMSQSAILGSLTEISATFR